jgi:RHS repeat-associated protein
MKKVQAEPGIAKQVLVNPDSTITINEINTAATVPTQLRWIGNGRTIKNNKGNAVKHYEPYFSVNWFYEDYKELVETGVTPKMYYDAAGRLIKTEMPDGTFSKVEFDSWKQKIYDANDTILESSWYLNRTNRLIDAELLAESKDPGREKLAADKAAKHAGTPNVLHFDTLGRPVLSIEHNKNITTDADEFYHTKVKLDAEGNLRTVTDARGNIVMQYKYDMLGNLVYQNSMDAGQRWLLTNILSKPLRTWDERNHEFQYFYDIAQRPTHSKVIGGDRKKADGSDDPLDNIFDKVVYGESLLTGIRTEANRFNEAALQARNILGQVIQHYDTGGLIDTPNYDFKGQPLATTRKLFRKYKEVVNWIDTSLVTDLETESFTFTTETDALGRIIEQTAPDGSIITPSYNEAGLLDGESVFHPGAANASVYIKDIDYNEKGHRNKIIYGNDVSTKFYYDKETFRLKRLESKRLNGDPLQDWYYTYDPVGNITHIEDKNVPVVFFDNQKITGVSSYTYDALYRLAEATGRENNAALNFGTCDNWYDKPFRHSMNPGDPMAIRNYTQRYQYDAVGNIIEMKHLAAGGNWTRGYEYEAVNNRLKRTFIGDNGNPANYTKYQHHAKHGFMEELPHLEKISWNFKEEVVLTSRQHCTDDNIPVITYYQYDGSGQRIRKITENQAAAGGTPTKKEERIYIAGYELYKKHTGTTAGLERESLSLMDEGHRFVMVETRNNINDGTEKQLVRYQLHNHLGSAALELDGIPDAKVISYEEYHPFGTTAYQAINKEIKSAAKRYRFTGMERDEETGLEYHSARYYLPWLGRWLSSDPIGIGDGVNLYCYSKNNALKFNDKLGTQSQTITFTDEDVQTHPEAHIVVGRRPDTNSHNPNDTNETPLTERVVNPDIANLPGNLYVDMFESVHYDLDYRAVGGNLSTWLQARYRDGTSIDISIYDISDTSPTPREAVEQMAQGHVGSGGRIFPQQLNPRTSPRLSAAKRAAIETMEEYNYEIMVAAIPAVLFILFMTASPVQRPTRTTSRLPSTRRVAAAGASSFNPAELAGQLISQHGGSARRIITEINAMGLSQRQVGQVLTEVFRQTGRDIGGTMMHGENLILLSRRVGSSQPINVISPSGQVTFGTADIVLEGLEIVARNIRY